MLVRDNPIALRYTLAMKSQFPAVDPYLESRWGDVNQGLITYARDALQPNLTPDLLTRVEPDSIAPERSARPARPASFTQPMVPQWPLRRHRLWRAARSTARD